MLDAEQMRNVLTDIDAVVKEALEANRSLRAELQAARTQAVKGIAAKLVDLS